MLRAIYFALHFAMIFLGVVLAIHFDFWKTYATQIVAIAPRTECQETPINDPKKTTHTREFSWGTHKWTDTKIEVDETRSTNVG